MKEQLNLFDQIIDRTETEPIEFRYEITSYGADYPVDSIVKRIDTDAIFVPPFQRRFVWDIYEASKFVESLILGLPVPGVFLSKQSDTNRLLIVDGQQRLLTLHSFYKGRFKDQEFKLTGVQDDLEGKNIKDISVADKNRLDDSIIHATIVRQDEPDDNESSIYQIFERINTGGRPLSPQEIRACIYYGEYNEFLQGLTSNINWRIIFGRHKNERLKEEELILRFFSLNFDLSYYEKPLKDFLNKRMAANRNFELHSMNKLKETFDQTIDFISRALGKNAFKVERGIQSAIFDSVMVGIAKRLEKGPINENDDFRLKYKTLLEDKSFKKLVDSGTSDESSIKDRIHISIDQFSKIG